MLYSSQGDGLQKPSGLLGKAAVGTWFDPSTGATQMLRWDQSAQIHKPSEGAWLLWIREE